MMNPPDFGASRLRRSACLPSSFRALFRGVPLPPIRIVLLLWLVSMGSRKRRPRCGILGAASRAHSRFTPGQANSGRGFGDQIPRSLRAACCSQSSRSRLLRNVVYPRSRFAPIFWARRLLRRRTDKLIWPAVFHDYDCGRYLISSGRRAFHDGRTKTVRRKSLSITRRVQIDGADNLFPLLAPTISRQLDRARRVRDKLLYHGEGWQKSIRRHLHHPLRRRVRSTYGAASSEAMKWLKSQRKISPNASKKRLSAQSQSGLDFFQAT